MKLAQAKRAVRSRISRTPALFAVVLSLAVARPACTEAPAADLTAAMALQQLRGMNPLSFRQRQEPEVETNFIKFRMLLASLAASPQPAASTPEERALLGVARGVSEHPERLDELLSVYGKPQNPMSRAVRPADLHPPHDTEAYRRAWEALLLAPAIGTVRIMNGNITQAISAVGNTDSIPLLQLAFSLTCHPDVDAHPSGSFDIRQREILRSLVDFPTEDSLRAILQSLDRDEAVVPLPGRASSGKKDLRGFVAKRLAGRPAPEKAKWRQVLRSLPKDSLPPKQREFLYRAEGDLAAEGQ